MTQNKLILNHLKKGKTITPLQAFSPKFGNCMALNSRISDLRHEGYKIETEFVTKNGKTFAKYKMI